MVGSRAPHRTARAAAVCVIVASMALLGACGESAASSRTPNLNALILRPAQVGPGYKRTIRAQDRTLTGQTSLKLCGFQYESEARRLARLKGFLLNLSPPEVEWVNIVNEVIAYRAGGARQALNELRRAAAHCPSSPPQAPGQKPTNYHLTRIAGVGLLRAYLAVRVEVTWTESGTAHGYTDFYVFQVRNNVLSVVFGSGKEPARVLPVVRHAAHESALSLGLR